MLIVLLLAFVIPPAGAQGEGSVTRSQTFTVTIAGTPYATYYVWLKGTFSLSGEPGDQPPVVVANQENVVQDQPGGPYTIGSYQYYNGGGRTILDDVAPSTATVSDTSYYAAVTTDQNGIGTIAFQTSRATAAQSFSIDAQNPGNPGQNVAISLGTPTQVPGSDSNAIPYKCPSNDFTDDDYDNRTCNEYNSSGDADARPDDSAGNNTDNEESAW